MGGLYSRHLQYIMFTLLKIDDTEAQGILFSNHFNAKTFCFRQLSLLLIYDFVCIYNFRQEAVSLKNNTFFSWFFCVCVMAQYKENM